MQKVISAAEMREIDRLTTERYGTPSLLLMERAAAATAQAVADHFSGSVAGKRVLVLCGRGNNGGDGAATARALAMMGAHAEAVVFGSVDEAKGDARVNFEIARSLAAGEAKITDVESPDVSALFKDSPGTLEFSECPSEKEWQNFLKSKESQPHVIVDALFGTGLTRPLEGVYREVVSYLKGLHDPRDASEKTPLIVSIDIPSGLNSDLSETIGDAVRADLTVSLTAPKPGNVLPPAANYNGKLLIADIGSPAELIESAASQLFLIEESDARDWLVKTRYTPDSYKNTHGHALIIAGSRGFTGAAALCGAAALRAGAGLVTVATPVSSQPTVAALVIPEVMTAALAETDRGTVSDEAVEHVLKFAERAEVLAIGPGLSAEHERTRAFVRAVVERRKTPVVIDADGLNSLSPWPSDLRGSREYPIVLTPHPGEMLRLMGARDKSALADRVAATREFATSKEVIVVLKGTRALIASPDGRVFVNPTGNAGLGTAGAGDTLTGIITGFLAQAYGYRTARGSERVSALETVIAALYLGGLAGDLAARARGMRTLVASDVRERLSEAICALDPEGERP